MTSPLLKKQTQKIHTLNKQEFKNIYTYIYKKSHKFSLSGGRIIRPERVLTE